MTTLEKRKKKGRLKSIMRYSSVAKQTVFLFIPLPQQNE
jgi:hypothetical protein